MNNKFRKETFTRETKRRVKKSRKAIGIVFAAIMLIAIFAVAVPIAAAQITVDGDGSDWIGLPASGLDTATDDGIMELGVNICGGYTLNWSSGYDLADFAMFYNASTDTLYFKFNLSGVPGDTDGDYNPDSCTNCSHSGPNGNCTDPWNTWPKASADHPGVTVGAYKVRLDADGDSSEDYRVMYHQNKVLVVDPTEMINHTGNFTTQGSIGLPPWSAANVTNIVEMSITPAHNMSGFGFCGDFIIKEVSSGTGNDYLPEDPISQFTANSAPVPIPVGDDVCLCTNTTLDGSASYDPDGTIVWWDWDLGDGNTSSGATLNKTSHHYASTGTYTVNLTVTDDYGFVCSNTTQVEVFENPVANFTFTEVCYCTNTTFTDATTGGTPSYTYDWDFDDGTAHSNAADPTHHYANPGTYNVTLNVTDANGCSNETTKQVEVFEVPVANFTFTEVCYCTNTTFTDATTGGTTPYTYDWDFDDGTPHSNAADPTHHYAAPGTYNVTLNVTDANGCSNETTKTVDVYDIPVANFTATNPCYCTNTMFTDATTGGTPSYTYDWDFDDGTAHSNAADPTHHYANPGTYNVTLNVTDANGCSNETTKQVQVFAGPTANFTFTEVCYCTNTTFTDTSVKGDGNIISYDWDFDDGTAHSNVVDPTHHYANPGKYNVTLTVTDDNDCVNETTKQVEVYEVPVADFTATSPCYCTNTTFTDATTGGTTPYTYDWDFDDGTPHSNATDPTHHYANPGTYNVTLTVTDDNGCVNATTKQVEVYEIPAANFTATDVCFCTNTEFTDATTGGTTPYTYDWDFGDATPHGNVANPTHHYAAPGTYNVTLNVTDAKGCSNETTKTVLVSESPTVSIDYVTEMCNLEVDFTGHASGGLPPYNYSWDFGDGNHSYTNGTMATSDVTGNTYPHYGPWDIRLTVTDSVGCEGNATVHIILTCPKPETVRVYGECGVEPGVYMNYTDPFDPTVLPKDSVTCNPAIMLGEDWSAQSNDIDLKKYLRLWYEPSHGYRGLEPDYTLQTHRYRTIIVESTYMLVDSKHGMPFHGSANDTWFPFPIAETDSQIGLSAFGNGAQLEDNSSAANVIKLVHVAGDTDSFNKTLNGTIRIEKTYDLASGEKVQFLDHTLTLKGIVKGPDGILWAKVAVQYAGNKDDDSRKTIVLGKFDKPAPGVPNAPHATTWFDRHNARYSRVDHNDYNSETPDKACRHTWYARFEDVHVWEQKVEITVGKELSRNDTFYVDSVRYDVPAIEVIDITGDGNAEKFKYITLRTPLPKSPEYPDKTVRDDSVVSSQWLDCIGVREVIPLNPPFNMMNHSMVDDINVPLWAPLKHMDKWPIGDPNGRPGIEYFPCAERYQTAQYPPPQWLMFFRAVPIDTGGDSISYPTIPSDWQIWDNYGGPFYPGNDFPTSWTCCGVVMEPPMQGDYTVFDTQGWIANDLEERIISNVNKTSIFYVDETIETRYSTDLLEKLNETGMGTSSLYENWTKFDIQSLPDQYTAFVFLPVPDVVAEHYIGGEYQGTINISKPGDYLITTSFIAPQALGDFPDGRVAFAYDNETENGLGGGLDIYVNDEAGIGYNNTIRIYGEDDFGAPSVYDNWEQPFNPTVIPKDSLTFDPAIMLGKDWSAQSHDIDVKKYLRVYYEPCHWYTGLLPEYTVQDEGTYPTIEVESTYMLIDSKHKKPWHGSANDTWFPFPIAEDETTTGPSYAGLELVENVQGEPEIVNLTTLSYVGGETEEYDKTTAGTIRLEKTYTLVPNETIQFLDHKLELVGPVENGPTNVTHIKVKVWYAGQTDDDAEKTVVLGVFDDGTPSDPNAVTWFDRHNARYGEVDHNNNNPETPSMYCRHTWYARGGEVSVWEDEAQVTIGKELQQGDTFYVDGVRYDVAAIEVIDIDGVPVGGERYQADKFKYITIRTPLPKRFGKLAGMDEVRDESVVSSQDIVTIPPCNPIPINPPFNSPHKIVDDTDVVLWAPLKLMDQWPTGDPNGRPCQEYFPGAERYLTMQYPPYAWLKYFRAVPLDTDGDITTPIPTDWQNWDNYGGPFYPGDDVPDNWTCAYCSMTMPGPADYTVFDNEHWIANDVDERIIDADALDFCYVDETMEPRYSTNLLEILHETFGSMEPPEESWTKFDILTLPDQYTEFKLQEMPDVVPNHYIGGEYQIPNWTDGTVLEGSYLVTTSFYAPNARGDLNPYQSYYDYLNRFAFTYDVNLNNNEGIYINEDPLWPEPPGYGQWLNLGEGWNSISFSVAPEGSNDPFDIFGQEIWYWNPATERWEVPDEVEVGKGYFIECSEAREVPLNGASFVLGWAAIEENLTANVFNLVGPGMYKIQVSPDYVTYRYDAVTGSYIETEILEPGKGYWIKPPSLPAPP